MTTGGQTLIHRIHAAPARAVLAVTGGGSGAIGALLSVPGASNTLLEAIVPYAGAALVDLLRAKPERFCEPRTARAMAMAAYQRARSLAARENLGEVPVIGVGCTASLASEPPKRGPHRAHVAWQSASETVCHSLEFIKGIRSRAEEETLTARLILRVLAEASEVEMAEQDDSFAAALQASETPTVTRARAEPGWAELLAGTIDRVPVEPRQPGGAAHLGRAIFPGAFNPLHDGHRRMADWASRALQTPVELELSIENVDKLPLDYWELQRRVGAIVEYPLWLSRAATFARKAELFPGATFVVGLDTVARIADPRYYHHDAAQVAAAIQRIASRGCRFLVFGRLYEGRFQTLDDLALPPALRSLCAGVDEGSFRADVSSTELRKAESGERKAEGDE